MQHYSVKEVSKMAGISIRTLHYYDRIGLLKPAFRTEAGYRHYGQNELLRLQQILFYRELDFALAEIQELLDDPDFDLITALQTHKEALMARRERIATLLQTVDITLNHLIHQQKMEKPEHLYAGLPKEMGTTYRDEAIAAYGIDAVRQAEQELSKLGKADFEKLKTDFATLWDELFDRKEEDPQSPAIQAAIHRHYLMIRQFWGTSGQEDLQAEPYTCLGDTYVEDPRFTERHGQAQPEFGKFLQAAMRHYAATSLKA